MTFMTVTHTHTRTHTYTHAHTAKHTHTHTLVYFLLVYAAVSLVRTKCVSVFLVVELNLSLDSCLHGGGASMFTNRTLRE